MVRKIKASKQAREEAFDDAELAQLGEMVFNTLWIDLANTVCGVVEPPDMERVTTEMVYSPVKKSLTWDEYLAKVKKTLLNGLDGTSVEPSVILASEK